MSNCSRGNSCLHASSSRQTVAVVFFVWPIDMPPPQLYQIKNLVRLFETEIWDFREPHNVIHSFVWLYSILQALASCKPYNTRLRSSSICSMDFLSYNGNYMSRAGTKRCERQVGNMTNFGCAHQYCRLREWRRTVGVEVGGQIWRDHSAGLVYLSLLLRIADPASCLYYVVIFSAAVAPNITAVQTQ